MTDHSGPRNNKADNEANNSKADNNANGHAGSQDGDHDPIIAERFRVLDRVAPPDVSPQALAVPAPGGWHPPDPSGRRSGFLAAVAASIVVLLVGVVAVIAASGGGGGTDLAEEAGESGDVPIVAGSASDTTGALVVEGDSAGVSTTRSENEGGQSDLVAGDSGRSNSQDEGPGDEGSTAGGSGESGGVDGAANAGTSTSSSGSTGSGSDSGGSGGPLSTSSVDPPVGMPAADGDRPVSTFSTATTDVLPTTGGGSGEASGTVALSGTVTEVFTDCVSRLLLTETGQVVQGGPVSCDGGSYIVVNGTRVFTSSGFTSADLAFDKHPSNLKPGQDVSVTATRTGGPSGPLTLACDACRVRIL